MVFKNDPKAATPAASADHLATLTAVGVDFDISINIGRLYRKKLFSMVI